MLSRQLAVGLDSFLCGLLLVTMLGQLERLSAETINVSNIEPKLSTMGLIVNGHDGTYQYFEGYYWYHAAEYGLCKEPPKNGCDMTLGPVGPPYPAPGHCGFQANHNVSIWRSKSLRSGSWEFVGRAASCAEDIPNCEILYRPHVVFNPSTRLYVLFVNYVMRGGSYKGNAVFTASNPAGPFTLRTPQMHLSRLCAGPSTVGQACGPAQGRCGDFDVVVDPSDGAGYIIYSCNHLMSIERLTPDYLQGGGTNSSVVGGLFGGTVFPENLVEAPAFFHRDGMFYALFGHCCCFCYQGSGVMVYTARSPAGPWEPQCSDVQQNTSCLSKSGDLACVSDEVPDHVSPVHVAGSPSPGQGCNYKNRPQRSSLRAQQNFVISVGDEFIWTGDRWQQSPDGLKGHEGQTWIVLSFDAAGRILPLRWQDVISFDVPNENVDALIV